MTAALVLVRHGRTAWNAAGRLQGSSDIVLDATGRAQAREVGVAMADGQWDLLVSSPLRRAVETAQIIGQWTGLEPGTTTAGLCERNYGAAEGQYLGGLSELEINRLHAGAEPEEDVTRRGLNALRGLLEEHPKRRIIVVAHGTLLRLTISALLGRPYPRISNGEFVEVEPKLVLGFQSAF